MMKKLLYTLVAILISLTASAQRDGDKITITLKNGKTSVYNLTGTTDPLGSLKLSPTKMEVYVKGWEEFGAWETFSIDDISNVTFSVYKESDVSDVTLADPLATTATRRLFKYIRTCYGVKTLSSVMAEVNWNTRLAENIYKQTGRYPAFNCFDFIHIYVPKGNGWIDYDDITPVTSWTDAGGLVQLMWHFNVPLSESTTVGRDGSGVTCSPDKTTFRAANALVSGTWENRWFYEQMDLVADVLLKLQQNGISAVWRPFHEAAGNACLKSGASWAKSWFWWGIDGAETYKSLWKAMFDYFQQKGIHNLIWTWTSQNYNGDATRYDNDAAWYPGDAYVDIIGRDLYGSSAADNKMEYAELSARYPGKMITLAECGNSENSTFARISDIWNAGARWSWFMPWYGSNLPDASWWADAMSCPDVITRDMVNVNATYIEESAASAVRNMGLGFNLGNTFDACGEWIGDHKDPSAYETAWGQPLVTASQMAFLKSGGFNSVRIPVSWNQHIDAEGNVDVAWMDRIEEVVNFALDNGLYVILNVHHDTGSGTEPQKWLKADADNYARYSSRYKTLWRQIATRFSKYSHRLLFEGYNEMLDAGNHWTFPSDKASYAVVNSYAQDFVNTVRATGGNNLTRNLIVNTYSAAQQQEVIDNLVIPTDNTPGHIAVEVHSYDPYDWVNTYGEWNAACSNETKAMFTRLNTRFVSKGIPCIIGEYGPHGNNVTINASSSDKLKKAAADQAADMVAQAKALDIATFYWMSIFDANDRTVPQWTLPTVVDAMRAAYAK